MFACVCVGVYVCMCVCVKAYLMSRKVDLTNDTKEEITKQAYARALAEKQADANAAKTQKQFKKWMQIKKEISKFTYDSFLSNHHSFQR